MLSGTYAQSQDKDTRTLVFVDDTRAIVTRTTKMHLPLPSIHYTLKEHLLDAMTKTRNADASPTILLYNQGCNYSKRAPLVD